MEKITLKIQNRDLLGKKVKILRGKGQIPSVLYGRNFSPISIIVDKKDLLKVLQHASESTIIDLDAQKDNFKALIRDIQKDPVTDDILHVDFYKVDMNQEIQTEIPLKFIGVSPAVAELEGNFITNKDAIKVECLPDKLVGEIVIDISSLKTFEDLIHIKDLPVPAGINVLEEEDDIVAQVTPPLSEEELEKMEGETAATAEKAQIENIETQAEQEKADKEAEEGTTEEQSQEQSQKAPKNE